MTVFDFYAGAAALVAAMVVGYTLISLVAVVFALVLHMQDMRMAMADEHGNWLNAMDELRGRLMESNDNANLWACKYERLNESWRDTLAQLCNAENRLHKRNMMIKKMRKERDVMRAAMHKDKLIISSYRTAKREELANSKKYETLYAELAHQCYVERAAKEKAQAAFNELRDLAMNERTASETLIKLLEEQVAILRRN